MVNVKINVMRFFIAIIIHAKTVGRSATIMESFGFKGIEFCCNFNKKMGMGFGKQIFT